MSRRREAADLARALLLSTQEASTVAQLSPHTLSSSKSGTQDSREMELHAILQPPPSAPSASIPPSTPSAATWGLPPMVRTFAQDDGEGGGIVPLPSALDLSDPIVTALTPSLAGPSAIASFTPTKSTSTPPSIPPHVAATDSSSPRPTAPPRLTSTTSSTGTGSVSSGKVVYSSPNMPIPSSRLSVGDKTHVSSSGSSHRPLFSPTQTSYRPPIPLKPNPEVEPSRPRSVTTYGRSQGHNQIATVLTPAPDRIRSISPLKASGPPLLPTSTPPFEEPEPVEHRNSPQSVSKSTVEVVLPSRGASKSKVVSPIKQRTERHYSPDPLDTNIRRQSITTTPVPYPIASTSKNTGMVSSVKTPSASSARCRATSYPSGTQQSDKSDNSSAPARMSKRQLAQKEKEEAEAEARREARRIRKEKERLEKERAEEEARRPRDRGSKPGFEEENESVVVLAGPSRRTPARSRVRSTATPTELIVVDDETQVVEIAKDRPSPRREDAIPEEEEDIPTSARKPTERNKKRKKVIRDEDDEDEEWGGSDDDGKFTKKAIGDKKMPEVAPIGDADQNIIGNLEASPAVVPIIAEMDESVVALPADPTPVEPVAKPNKKGKAAPKPKKPRISAKAQALADKAAKAKEVEAEAEAEADGEAVEVEKEDDVARVTAIEPQADAFKRATSSLSPVKSASPPAVETPRPPLRPALTSVNSSTPGPSHRASPGPSNLAGGIKWKTSRSDLSSVLSKFGGARQSGMSRRGKIVSLHAKIGPPVKALPPPPPKPSKKKKDESDEEDSDEAEMESDGEGGTRKKKKVKGMEWYMMED